MTVGADRSADGRTIEVATLLSRCGLAAVGDPPEATLDVLGRAVHVVVRGDADWLQLEARLAVSTSPPSVARLRSRSLDLDGDTRITVEVGELVARRTLVQPRAAAVFDAVHELGKAVVALAGAEARPPDEPAPDDVPLSRPTAMPTPVPSATSGDAGYWCFVDESTPVLAAPGSDEVVAMLMPRVWYRVERDEGGWAHVRHPSGVEGVVARREVTPA
jgi:hypothetical protein